MAIWCQLSKLSKSTGQWTFFPGLTTQLDGYRITLIISDPCRWIFIAYFFMVPCWSEYPTDCLVDMSTCDFGALTSRTSAETQPKKSSVLVGSRCSSSHAKTILATCLWCELQRYRILIRNSAATDVLFPYSGASSIAEKRQHRAHRTELVHGRHGNSWTQATLVLDSVKKSSTPTSP